MLRLSIRLNCQPGCLQGCGGSVRMLMNRRTRRDAKNRPKAAVLAGLMMGTLAMSGCGPAQADNTLTWYINPDAGGQAAMAQKCSEESGGRYRIETSLLPTD